MTQNQMNQTSALTVQAVGDFEIIVTRSFNAPRPLVWDANTKPELIRRWLGVRNSWEFVVCEVDLRVGGAYKYTWRHPKRGDMTICGEFREIAAPEKLTTTERFEQPWYPG